MPCMQCIHNMHTVKINNKEKSTSIRISERTKRMLDAMSVGKETHEKIILRLIKQGNTSTNTQIIIKKNVVGTKYNRLNRMLNIETDNGQFAVVFTYNDFKPLQDNKLDWEVDLELINIKKNNGKWEEPKKEELFYFVILKYLLEYTFSMQL